MENDVMIVAIFVGAGLLGYVVIPGLLIMWDHGLFEELSVSHRGAVRRGTGPHGPDRLGEEAGVRTCFSRA